MVMDLLVDTARDQRATVLIVTHEARVAAYADREVVVRDGRVRDRVTRVAGVGGVAP
jgi:putative ABC transport system ATP-binding protein